MTFCRLRKSLALRRKYLYPPAIQFWYRGLRPLCPPAARPVVAPYVLRIRRGVSGVGPAHRRAKKAPLKRGLSAELTGGFCPRVQRRGKKPPGIAFGHASPFFKGGMVGGDAPTHGAGIPREVYVCIQLFPKIVPQRAKKRAGCTKSYTLPFLAGGAGCPAECF